MGSHRQAKEGGFSRLMGRGSGPEIGPNCDADGAEGKQPQARERLPHRSKLSCNAVFAPLT